MTNSEYAPGERSKSDEEQSWKGFSVFLHVLLPIAGLALLWGQRGIFAKLLLQLDRNCVAVYCPSLSKRGKLLQWVSARLPLTWSSQARTLSSGITELWKDGSLLCTLINSVVPGACPNPHRHWKKSPLHAQALAYKYLGLAPMFTDSELSGDLTINQEQRFMQYLHKLQEIINKFSVDDGTSHKLSSQYVARGMGLFTGEQNRKTVFYVYANVTAKKHSSVLMYIRGPYGTHGKATITAFHNTNTMPVVGLQNQRERTKILPSNNEQKRSFLKTISLDFATLINNVENKGEEGVIPIQIEMENDRTKVTYIPNDTGIHEINLICDGEVLNGSPYSVQVVDNTTGTEDSFDTESRVPQTQVTLKKKRVISKIIDCIDEKIIVDHEFEEPNVEEDVGDNTLLKSELKSTLENIIEENPHTEDDVNAADTVDNTDDFTETINLTTNKDCDQIVYKVQVDCPKNIQISEFDIGCITIKKQKAKTKKTKSLKSKTKLEKADNNNNTPSKPKLIESKILIEISSKHNASTELSENTSPICPSHIAPEVGTTNRKLTLTEKRKRFSMREGDKTDDELKFSVSVNEDSSKSKEEFRELSVLNVLDSLRQSPRNSISESTVSLPDIVSHESNRQSNNFREKKDYWEKLSSRSSSTTSLTNSDRGTKKNDAIQKKAPVSVDRVPVKSSTKEARLDSSLEDCVLIPFKERKKQLLNNMNNAEEKKSNQNQHFDTSKSKLEDVPKPDQALNKEEIKKDVVHSFKSRFKKAFKFFRNLEGNDSKKRRKVDLLKRRHSLDVETKRQRKILSGSLNLPNVSDRFFVNNLYDDIFGNKYGSFKGTPNKSKVSQALASFSKHAQKEKLDREDEGISYNLFVNKLKSKKRKSVKSLFDVNY